MGFLQQKNITFLNVSKGALVNKAKGINEKGVTGNLLSIKRTLDKFEGKEVSKIEVELADNDPNSDVIYNIKFTECSYFSLSFFNRLALVPDVCKPITIGVSGSEQNEKMSFCWMKCNGSSETIKPDKEKSIKPGKVKVSGVDILDWGKCMDFYSSVMDKVNAELLNTVDEPSKPEYASSPEETQAQSDLPF